MNPFTKYTICIGVCAFLLWGGIALAQTYDYPPNSFCKSWTCYGTVTGYDPTVDNNVTCTLDGQSTVITCVPTPGPTCTREITFPKSKGYQVCPGLLFQDGKTPCTIAYNRCLSN